MNSSTEGIETPSELIRFGKFLITFLGITVNSDAIDWKKILRNYDGKVVRNKPEIMYINWVVCKYYKQDPVEVRYNKNRGIGLIRVRQVAQYIALVIFGHRNYKLLEFYEFKRAGTIINNVQRIKDLSDTEPELKDDIENIIIKLMEYYE